MVQKIALCFLSLLAKVGPDSFSVGAVYTSATLHKGTVLHPGTAGFSIPFRWKRVNVIWIKLTNVTQRKKLSA